MRCKDCNGVGMTRIKLTQGKYALVSPEDFEYLSRFKWQLGGRKRRNYAVRDIYLGKTEEGKFKDVPMAMHREVMMLKQGDHMQVDHINHDGLDNRRENLRVCTWSQNQMNRKPHPSKIRGGYYIKRLKKWRVSISKNSNRFEVGLFNTKEEAVLAYDKKAKELFGEFANTNSEWAKKKGVEI